MNAHPQFAKIGAPGAAPFRLPALFRDHAVELGGNALAGFDLE